MDTQEPSSLGGHLPLLKPADLPADQRRLHAELVAAMVSWAKRSGFQAETAAGELIGPFNPMLRSPAISHAVLGLIAAESEHTDLSERVRQVVILAVGAVWGAAYELYAHAAVAGQAGFDQATITALVAGQAPGTLTEEERLAHEFTRALVAEHQIGPDLYGRAVGTFGEKGVVDMIYLAGNYMTVSALLNAFAVPAPATRY